jgi:hypothetical protein
MTARAKVSDPLGVGLWTLTQHRVVSIVETCRNASAVTVSNRRSIALPLSADWVTAEAKSCYISKLLFA